MGSPLLFAVQRPCSPGLCGGSKTGACTCFDPTIYVDVDELTDAEIEGFRSHGTAEQRAEISDWLHEDIDPAELIAGQPDRAPELVPA